jgi:hypothetical protein
MSIVNIHARRGAFRIKERSDVGPGEVSNRIPQLVTIKTCSQAMTITRASRD